MAKKKTDNVEIFEQHLKIEEIKEFVKEQLNEKFPDVKKHLKILEEIKIEDSATFDIGVQTRKDLKVYIESISSLKKDLGKAVNEINNTIDAVFVGKFKAIEVAALRHSEDVINFQKQKLEEIEVQIKPLIKEAEENNKNKKVIVADLYRKALHAYALVLGGEYPSKKDGQPLHSEAPIDKLRMKEVKDFFEDKFPKAETFECYKELAEDIIANLDDAIIRRGKFIHIAITNSDDHSDYDVKTAIKNHDEYKAKIIPALEKQFKVVYKALEKELVSDIKEVESAYESYKTGIKNTWTFEIEKESLITDEFKSIDEKKIKAYLSKNKDEIKKGESLLPGVKFYTVKQGFGG